MKKILLYTDTPLIGGAENQMYLLAKFLPRKDYSVSLACSNLETLNNWAGLFKEIKCEVIRLKVSHKHDPRHFIHAKNIFPNFDLIHIHAWNPASNRWALAVKSVLRKGTAPVVITEHDPFPLGGFKKWIKSKLINEVSKIIFPSRGACKSFLDEFPDLMDKTVVIPNGIDSQKWERQIKNALMERNESAATLREILRKDMYKADLKDRIIVCVAELNHRKGQKYLIEGFESVARRHPEARLVFVGDGPARDEYEYITLNHVHSSIRDRIRFLGRQQDIAGLMAAADIFVLPSIREAFGLVLLEAALAKLPIIATNVGGIPEILENEKTGLLVDPASSESMANALDSLLSNVQKSKTLAKNAYSHVHKNFHAKNMAKLTAEVYDGIL